ncbi:MAG: rod shape-determining protein MreD [Polyangiaceae bacterium UTPRO1]|nr:rod shape-determining protein MreD [Myxococcales bacterium]OQY65802.1 MAG: rod shape-determining protein MreD [Polyangiaceae bacterium UTPRO1]
MSLLQTSHAPAPSIGAELRTAGFYALAGALALLLQTTVLHGLTDGRIIPDLVLILCVYLGLYEHNIGGATGAFLFGYLLDSFSGSVVGLHAFAMTVVYLVVYLVSRRLWMDNTVSGVVMVFFGSLLKGVAIVAALAAYLAIDRMSLGVAQALLAEALLAAALTPLVFGALGWAKRLTGGN